MPGSEPQTLKDVTSGLRMCEVLQVTYLESKVWESHTARWKAIACRGQMIPIKGNGSESNQRPKPTQVSGPL